MCLGTKCEQLYYIIWSFTTLIIVRCLFIKFRREFWAEHFLFPNCVTKQLSKNESFSLKILSNSLISEEYDLGNSLILSIWVCAAPKGIDLASFWSENGYRFCPFWSTFWSFMVYKGVYVVYECVLLAYNLRDDYIISVDVNMYCCVLWPPPGPKTGMDFWGQVWKRVWKMTIFWSEVGSGLVEPGVVHPYQEFPGVPSPGNMKESTNPISQPSSILFLKS